MSENEKMTKPKSRKGLVIAGIIAAVLLLTAGIIFGVTRSSKLKPAPKVAIDKSTPESYLRGVLQNELNGAVDNVYLYFANILKDFDITNFNVNVDMKAEPSAAFLEFFSGSIGLDISCVKNILFNINTTMCKGDQDMTYGLGINDVDVVSYRIISKSKDGKMYMNIPEVFSKAFLVKLDQTTGEMTSEFLDLYAKLLKAFAVDKTRLQNMISHYLDIIAQSDHKVNMTNGIYDIDTLSMEATSFSGAMDIGTFDKILISILEEVKKDTEFQDFVKEIVETLNYVNEYLHIYDSLNLEDFNAGIDELIADLKQNVEDPEYSKLPLFNYIMYVDSNDSLCAVKFDFDDGIKFSVGSVTDGKNEVSEIYFDTDEDITVTLKGKGVKENDILTKEYDLYVNNYDTEGPVRLFTMNLDNFDLASLKKGIAKGRASIGDFNKEVLAEIPLVSDMKFIFDYNYDSRVKGNVKVGTLYKDQDFLNINMDVILKKGSKVSIPKGDAVETTVETLNTDMIQYLDYNPIMSNLEKAGCSDLVTQIMMLLMSDAF